jgi:hypothetical protein
VLLLVVRVFLTSLLALALAGCAARGPVVDTGEKPPSVSGTISGFVRIAGANTPLAARKVTATEIATGASYTASTAANGGYTMKVPMGKYRLQVELQAGETIVDAPGELEINRSDLDAGRTFTITVKR